MTTQPRTDQVSPLGAAESRLADDAAAARLQRSDPAGATTSQAAEIAAAAEQWRTEGWALLDGLVPVDEVAAARAEIEDRRMDPPTGRGPLRRADRHRKPRDEPADDGAAFREEQFAGTVLFPIPDAPNLNRLFVHPRLVAFAEAALGTDDLRIYQSRIWSKFSDVANYEQPLHRDLNHSLVPTRSEPGWWFLECFLYLGDVDERNGAPRLVPRSASVAAGEPAARHPVDRSEQPGLYAAEMAAPGSAGSLLAYRSDVWHRGIDLEPGTERHIAVVAFKPAGLDWVGFDAHPPLINNPDFVRFAAACTPRELALFGVPEPGHPIWTDDMVDGLSRMYPGLDVTPWQAAVPDHPTP